MVTLKHIIYKLPLSREALAYFPKGQRSGLLLRIELSDAYVCMGEYAPLLGIHQASIEEALFLIERADLFLIEEFLVANIKDAAQLVNRFPYPLSQLLSLAYFDRYLEKRLDLASHSVQLSALIVDDSVLQAVLKAHNYIAQGYKCLKIKILGNNIIEEVEKIKRIAALNPDIRIRLDANKRLSLADAKILLKKLSNINIEYFEEPLLNNSELANLYEDIGVKIAVDESFDEISSLEQVYTNGARYIILKPSRFSSIFAVLYICQEAAKFNITPIFSTCFESDLFCSIIALIIADCGLINNSHGILADNFFSKNLTPIPLRPTRGELLLSQPLATLKVLRQEI